MPETAVDCVLHTTISAVTVVDINTVSVSGY